MRMRKQSLNTVHDRVGGVTGSELPRTSIIRSSSVSAFLTKPMTLSFQSRHTNMQQFESAQKVKDKIPPPMGVIKYCEAFKDMRVGFSHLYSSVNRK